MTLRIGMPVVGAQSARAFSQPKFGRLSEQQEAKVFELLTPDQQLGTLISQYEALERKFGFESTGQAAERKAQMGKVENQMYLVVRSREFTPEMAQEAISGLYEQREELSHQLPDRIFDALIQKAKMPTRRAPEELPASIRKRMGRGDGAIVRNVSPELLKAILAGAGDGRN